MGRGLAEALATSGLQVILVDVSEQILADAMDHIGYSLKSAALFDPKLRENFNETMARIRTTTDYGSLQAAQFIIESTTEKWSVKKDVYARLSDICSPDCVLAANTSVISIAKIAAETRDPSSVLGMHFMNPVPKKPAVEVIRSPFTSDRTIETACNLLDQIGKRAIIVNDKPGFVTNRVLMLTINEAIAVVEEGVSTASDVDDIFVSCFSHAMGPLATADLIGLDTILLSLNELYASYEDDKYLPAQLLRDMVANGELGRKTGHGFFDYKQRSIAK